MKKLQDLMNEISEWSNNTFGEAQKTIPILHHLKKEIPELIEEIEKSEGRGYSTILFEFADCFMLLLDAATHSGYTADVIEEAIRAKLDINKARKWGNPDENGVIEHIKE